MRALQLLNPIMKVIVHLVRNTSSRFSSKLNGTLLNRFLTSMEKGDGRAGDGKEGSKGRVGWR